MATTEHLMAQYGVAWFGFDESSGNVYDKLGLGGYVGTVTGATRVEGWNGEGSAIQSNAINQRVLFNAPILPNDNFTIKFKIKCLPNTNVSYFLDTTGTLSNTNRGLSFFIANNELRISYMHSTGWVNEVAVNNVIVPDNKWHEVMYSFNDSIIKVYIDSVLTNTLNSSVTTFSHTQNLSLLNCTNFIATAGRFLNGQIDDLQIYAKALSPSDFTQKRLAVKSSDNKNLSILNSRIKEVPNTNETTLLEQGRIIREIDDAIDAKPIDLTFNSTQYEITNNINSPLGNSKVFSLPINRSFKTITIEDNY